MPRARTFALATSVVVLGVSLAPWLASAAWWCDVFAHGRMQYAAIAGAGLLFAGLRRLHAAAALFGAALAINLASILVVTWPRPDREGHADRAWSILAYNTWRRNEDWESVRRVLESGAPDVWVLEEVTEPVARGATAWGPAHVAGGTVIGVRRGSRARLVGPVSLPEEAEGACAARITIDSQAVVLVGMHLEAPLSAEATTRRDRSVLALATWIRAQELPVIVAGDFNATPWSRTFQRFLSASGLVDSEAGHTVLATWPLHQPRALTWVFGIPIDHCLVDPQLRVLERTALDAARSNHRPLLVRLAPGS